MDEVNGLGELVVSYIRRSLIKENTVDRCHFRGFSDLVAIFV